MTNLTQQSDLNGPMLTVVLTCSDKISAPLKVRDCYDDDSVTLYLV